MRVIYKFSGKKQVFSYPLQSNRGSVDRETLKAWIAREHNLDLHDCELELTPIPEIPRSAPIPYYTRVIVRRLPIKKAD